MAGREAEAKRVKGTVQSPTADQIDFRVPGGAGFRVQGLCLQSPILFNYFFFPWDSINIKQISLVLGS